MRKASLLVSILFLALSVGANPTFASSSPKPGAKCTKVGQTQVLGNKKYTCTKSGSKLTWNKGVTALAKASPSASASSEPSTSPVEETPSASTSSNASTASGLVKYKNCTEAKAAGVAPLNKTKTPELYELNSGLDRDKDGVACEN